ncbi:MAG: hypothetical protein WAT58_12070 [Candidatus Dormiibacterota bacterium]
MKNEFAAASLRLIHSGGATQLLIEDLETHRSIALDALMVASLPWAKDRIWDGIVDPSLRAPEG